MIMMIVLHDEADSRGEQTGKEVMGKEGEILVATVGGGGGQCSCRC